MSVRTGPIAASGAIVVSPRNTEIPKAWVIILVLGAALVLAPFAGWIVLAIWLSGFARGLFERLTHRLLGRSHLAAFLTCVLLMLVLVPIGVVLAMLVMDAIALVTQLSHNDRLHSVLVDLVSKDKANTRASIGELLMSQGDRALALAKVIFTSAANIIIGLVIVIAGVYSMLLDGRRWYAWADERAPIGSNALRRMADAFVETGRGLAFGVVGAGLLQALAATVAYLVLGVPQALPLGLLTLLVSVLPAIGTALVWVPVAVGLALSDRLYAGIGLAIYGVVVIGSIDNLARPWLARRGKLQLPTFVVLVSMFGAVELFGGWGILFGPLIVRLAKEALEVRREAMQP
jgi:predicted PurR-regulated permease PerM